MITLLIRCSYRPEGFSRTFASIPSGITVMCSYDDDRALTYIPPHLRKIRVHKHNALFFYDNYCNQLKELVTEGYFAFLDEGDVLAPGAIHLVSKYLGGSNGLICQFKRGDKVKPPDDHMKHRRIMRGKVGLPCLFLHHTHKHVADFDGSVGAADYHWIKAVSRVVKLRFLPIVVVIAETRDNGATED
jgi:hypothetical protein